MNFKEHFTDIYDNKRWGNGSGGGSEISSTIQYREFLQNFLKEKNIKSVIDYGCGDWQSSHLIDFSGIVYLGVDCVDSVIEQNNIKYSKDNIKFIVLDDMTQFFSYTSDLLILKDIIQHWSNDDIDYFLPNVINNFKYVLINNSSHQSYDYQDEPKYNRPLSAKFQPLKKYNPEIFLEYNAYNNKEVSIIDNTKNINIL